MSSYSEKFSIEDPKKASMFLKSLANNNRLVIVCALANGEHNVSQLGGLLGIRQPTLSQQLARLRADGIVSTRRKSKKIFYSLASKEAKRVISMLCLPRSA
jgi:ArsR family transcriptional regulator